MTVARSIPAGLAYRLLARAPGSTVGRARTSRLAPLLERAFVTLGLPLYGSVVPIAHGPAAGLKLVAERRSLVWVSGRVEQDVQEVLLNHLEQGGTFIDAGASVGFFTLLGARLAGPEGTVVAFEPQPAAAEAVRRNVDLNGFRRVTVVEAALSSHDGRTRLEGLGKATARVTRGHEDAGEAIDVACASLDRFLHERPEITPDLVKIDVEGHEVDVLDGMRETLAASRPVVVVECHDRPDDVRARLEEAGYAVSVLGGPTPPSQAQTSAHLLGEPC